MSHAEQLQDIINKFVLTKCVTTYDESPQVIEPLRSLIIEQIIKNDTLKHVDKQAMIALFLDVKQVNEMIKKGFEFEKQHNIIANTKPTETDTKPTESKTESDESKAKTQAELNARFDDTVMADLEEYNKLVKLLNNTIDQLIPKLTQKIESVVLTNDTRYQELVNTKNTLETTLSQLRATKLSDKYSLSLNIKDVEKMIQTVNSDITKLMQANASKHVFTINQLTNFQNNIKPIFSAYDDKQADVKACLEVLKPYIAEMITDETGIKTIKFKTTGTSDDRKMYKELCNCIKNGHSVLGHYLNGKSEYQVYIKLRTIFSYLGFDSVSVDNKFILTRDDTQTQKYVKNSCWHADDIITTLNKHYTTDIMYAFNPHNFN